MALRISSVAAFALGAAVFCSAGRCLAAEPTATLVVEATWDGGAGDVNAATLRQLIAWRHGDLRIPKSHYPWLSLDVKRIVEGRMEDEDFLQRPVGVNAQDVLVLDEAAAGLDAQRVPRATGLWRLQRLPNGAYAVSELRDTPFDFARGEEELAATKKMAEDLRSTDAQTQYLALRAFRERRCFDQVPAVLAMLDSDAKVTVPDGMHWDGPAGGGVSPTFSRLKAEAAAALARVLGGDLRGRNGPKINDPAVKWREHWASILATPPFPTVPVPPGPLRTVMSLAMNQSWPELCVSPDGAHAVLTFSRLEKPVDNLRSGVCLLDLAGDATRQTYLYRVPLSERNLEPTRLRVAWGKDRLAACWWEYEYDPEKRVLRFGVFDYAGRVLCPLRRLDLPDAARVALCEVKGGWLLAYTTAKWQAFAVALDSTGTASRTPLRIGGRAEAVKDSQARQEVTVVIDTPEGPVIAFAAIDNAYLAFLNHDLALRKAMPIHEAGEPGVGDLPQLAWNGETLCAAWSQCDNYGARLFARLYDAAGTPLTAAQCLSEYCYGEALVPTPHGFVVSWGDQSETAYQIRVATVDLPGGAGAPRIVHDGRSRPHSICGGWRPGPAQAGMARVVFLDRTRYPYGVMVKDVDLQ